MVRLTEGAFVVTKSHMKEISIRELHRRTGAWVRSARKYGSILVRDGNLPVAKLVPVDSEPQENRFSALETAEEVCPQPSIAR